MHPTEPYVECFEETWLPFQESRDPEGEEIVCKIAEHLRYIFNVILVLLTGHQGQQIEMSLT